MNLLASRATTVANHGGDGSAEGRHPKPAARGCNEMLPADDSHLKIPADGDEHRNLKLPAGSGTTLATPGGDGSAEGRYPKHAGSG
jgi:hypothetical protein